MYIYIYYYYYIYIIIRRPKPIVGKNHVVLGQGK